MSSVIKLSRLAALWRKNRYNRGVSAIEYGLLAGLIALVIIAAITKLGTNLNSVFSGISSSI